MKPLGLMEIVKQVYAIDYTAVDRQVQVTGVEFDSRKIKPGDLFIPLTGGRTDGHDYVNQAIAQGAVATLWSRDQDQAPSDDIATIFVDDTLIAFQDLANYYRQQLDPIVIGVTGSNGKTTTKDMTANVLSAKYRVHKTQGNYNNEIGLPYTILTMPEETQVLVVEMGMSDFGEIGLLSRIAQPYIAAITLIGESHLEFLGTRQGIAQAKLEILDGMSDEAVLIYPGGEPLIEAELERRVAQVDRLSVGYDSAYDVYAYDLVEEQDRTFFRTNLDENVLCMIPVIGAYNVSNALIALTIGDQLQVPMEQAIFQLSQFKLTSNRLEWRQTKSGAQLLNDAYNASPTSMKAVLSTLTTANIEFDGAKIAVLGDIRELGPDSASYHRDLANYIDPEEIQAVYLFGPEMAVLYEELQAKYEPDQLFYEEADHERLIAALEERITPDDIVLVKSSFGVDLLSVVEVLC